MIKVDTSKTGLVRGYYIYAQWGAGCIGMDEAKDENNVRVGIAYTLWHRHDDDPQKVEKELEALTRIYGKFRDSEGGMMGFEYRPYSN